MKTFTRDQFVKWGELGPKKRKHRTLTTEQAMAMVQAKKRKAKKK